MGYIFYLLFTSKRQESPVFWETMLGRHVKPGNGRKGKRAAWPPQPHLLGQTRKQETGKGGGGTVGQRGRERWKLWRKREEARCALSFRPTIKSLPKLSSPLSSSPSLMAFTSSVNFLRMPAWSILRLACNVSRFLFFLTPVLQNQPPPSRRGAQREIKRTGRGRMRNK